MNFPLGRPPEFTQIFSLRIDISYAHFGDCTHTNKRIDHEAYQGTIRQADY